MKRRGAGRLLLGGGVLLAAGQAALAQSQPATGYAITHAKIFTVSGAPIEDGTLVIRDGEIAAVGANAEIPAGVQVIDGKGLQVYPGLFDAVTQMGLSEISAVSATVDSAETGPYNPDVVAATAVLPSSEHIPVTRAAGITEVLAVPGSGGFDFSGSRGVIGGQASAIHLSGWTIDEMLLKKSVAMAVNWPEIETRTFDFTTFSRKEILPAPSIVTVRRAGLPLTPAAEFLLDLIRRNVPGARSRKQLRSI